MKEINIVKHDTKFTWNIISDILNINESNKSSIIGIVFNKENEIINDKYNSVDWNRFLTNVISNNSIG